MTNKEKELWLSVKYPITIISDRYDGTYSGAPWLAFPLDYDKIPEDVDGDDMLCSQFWKNYKEPVGKGGCAEEAIDNLLLEMELTESEDERIRKELISQVEKSGHHPSDKARWIAWLEKQKEQKPVGWKPQPESLEALMYAIEGKWGKISPTSYLSRRLEDLYEGLVNTFNVDESLLTELPKVASRAYTAEDIEKLRALKDKIEASMESPENKPAEWSEEDEKVIEAACALLCEYAGYYKEKDMEAKDLQLFKVSQRLKSLRPSWKPSEEQMEAFYQVVFALKPDKELESLYFDLKKL